MNNLSNKENRNEKKERTSNRSRSRSREKEGNYKNNNHFSKRKQSYSDYSYSYSDYSDYSDSSNDLDRINYNKSNHKIDTQNEKTIHNQSKLSDKSSSRIREKLPLPDLGIMKRMMSSIHNSNQNAEIRDKSASQRKLEELEKKLGYRK